jgi:hypothetical protein
MKFLDHWLTKLVGVTAYTINIVYLVGDIRDQNALATMFNAFGATGGFIYCIGAMLKEKESKP